MGRPTSNPKINRIELRLSDNDIDKLNLCTEMTGLSKSEVIRLGIDKVYTEIKKWAGAVPSTKAYSTHKIDRENLSINIIL